MRLGHNSIKKFYDISTTNNKNELSIVVYFGVQEGRLNEFKEKFNNQQKIVYNRQQNYR